MRKLKVNREDAKTKIKQEKSLQHQFPCVIQQSIEILEDQG
jgi:hypothetical protein